MKTLKSALENEVPENEAPSESAIPINRYGATRSDLAKASGALARLSEEVSTMGWIHGDMWRESLTKFFGQEFYEWLAELVPGNITPIQVQQMLSAHERNFKMPLPSTLVLDVKNERLRWDLSIKIIALMKQHVE